MVCQNSDLVDLMVLKKGENDDMEVNKELLEYFFQFLEGPSPLNPVLSGYFFRIL